MSATRVQTSAFLWGDRHFPVTAFPEQAKALEASGVVDYMSMSTQLGSFVPPQLWTAENAPMAAVMADPDSLDDAFVLAAYCHAAAPSLGISVLTDGTRIGPAQLMQMMWTLSRLTQGRSMFHFGAGEAKQLKPFGWKRSEGLKRLEDTLRVSREFIEADGPIDFEGNLWKMERAWLGSARPYRPIINAMGGGPRLIDYATSHADGISCAAPCSWGTPEEASVAIASIKETLERKGRDPETFGFGIFCSALISDDEGLLDRAMDNPIVRWIAAVFGRINQGDWKPVGLDSPMPEDWAYHMKLLPYSTPDAFIDDVLSRTTREHCENGYIWGTPAVVASKLQAYVDAGVNFVAPADYFPVIGDADTAAAALPNSIEVMRLLKENNNQ